MEGPHQSGPGSGGETTSGNGDCTKFLDRCHGWWGVPLRVDWVGGDVNNDVEDPVVNVDYPLGGDGLDVGQVAGSEWRPGRGRWWERGSGQC